MEGDHSYVDAPVSVASTTGQRDSGNRNCRYRSQSVLFPWSSAVVRPGLREELLQGCMAPHSTEVHKNPQRLHVGLPGKIGKRYSPILLATVSVERQTNMNTKEIREQKSGLKLTERRRDIIVGLLLGDGHLETQNGGRTYRLKDEHGALQRDYVEWLFNELREWIPPTEPYMKLRSNGALRFFGQQLYERKKKVIPALIGRMLTPLSLAIWFMDDGSRKSAKHKTYIIHSLGYTKPDLLRIQNILQKKFGLKVALHQQKGHYWRLYIPSESARAFEQLTGKYMKPIASMNHKLVTNA